MYIENKLRCKMTFDQAKHYARNKKKKITLTNQEKKHELCSLNFIEIPCELYELEPK